MSELRIQLERARGDLDGSKRRLGESLNDLAIRNRLVDKLSRDLTEKELSLAKALGVIRRLEEDLNRIAPIVIPVAAPEKKDEVIKEAAEPEPEKAAPEHHNPPPLPSRHPDQPAAQGAIVKKFKKFISLDH
jgi:hypothetical protein